MKQPLEIFLTRLIRYFTRLDRIGRSWYIFVGYSILLVSTVFSYTVINHDYYKEAADTQQKRTIQNPSSR